MLLHQSVNRVLKVLVVILDLKEIQYVMMCYYSNIDILYIGSTWS